VAAGEIPGVTKPLLRPETDGSTLFFFVVADNYFWRETSQQHFPVFVVVKFAVV